MKEQIESERNFNINKSSFYSKVIQVNSMDQLTHEGWKVIKAKDDKMENAEKPVAIVSVIGNKNTGKSFIFHLLTGKVIPNGYTVTTEGLSLIIPDNDQNKDDNFILIDTAGTESPLLFDISSEKKIKEKDEKEAEEADEKKFIENMAKDRQITDYFIQKFILEKSDIFIYVVDNLTMTDQTSINRIINHYANKKIFIVHNLKTFIEKNQVEEYIEDTLLKSLTFDLEKEKYIDLGNRKISEDQNHYFFKQKLKENNRIIIHLIIANQDSNAGKYYNTFAIDYLNKQLRQVKEKRPFDIIKNLKDFLVSISGEIFNEKLDPNSIIGDENVIKVNSNKLDLKDCSIDELGNNIITDTIFKPKYRYGFYFDKDNKEYKFFLEIELYGIWHLTQRITTKDNYFIVRVEGKKEKVVTEKNYVSKNYLPGNEFSLEIKVENDKGFLGDPTVLEENGLYILLYSIRAKNVEEEVISVEGSEDEDV